MNRGCFLELFHSGSVLKKWSWCQGDRDVVTALCKHQPVCLAVSPGGRECQRKTEIWAHLGTGYKRKQSFPGSHLPRTSNLPTIHMPFPSADTLRWQLQQWILMLKIISTAFQQTHTKNRNQPKRKHQANKKPPETQEKEGAWERSFSA